MKRNVIISGDFNITEVTNEKNAAAPNESVVIKGKKASERLEILRKAGVDTGNLFAMGDDMVVRVVDGIPVQVYDDDPIYELIEEGGHVPERRLFRRWVMAQMFRILRKMSDYKLNFTQCLQFHGYEYSWKMLVEEIRVQERLYKAGDIENFNERHRFFNETVVLDMMDDYLSDLQKYVDDLKVKHCKGVPYKTIKCKHIFVDDILAKVFYPLNSVRDRVKFDTRDISDLYYNLKKFNSARVHLKQETKMSKAFVNAYKAAGAFYTMKNLIMFHGCKFREKGKFVSKAHSLQILTKHSKDYNDWRLLGIMKEFIEDNGISVEGKISEWRKAKRAKK